MDSTEDGCVKALKHTSCQPGQYIRQKGWFSPADFKIIVVVEVLNGNTMT